ncbi:MAG TPA: uroporphyrinogen-III synthase, partial [Terriglobia bacterium]|nr:uroporphyrinogen-III synthase [Terriglobia bacterium]
CIEIRDPASWQPLDDAIRRLNEFDFLLVTSVNGVRNFMARLQACGLDSRSLKGIEVGAIGPATAADLARYGVRADFVPREYRAEGLIEELGKREIQGKSFLIPRARVARDLVPRALQERGARVEVIEAYYAAAPENRSDHLEALLSPAPHVITFTSSSTATNFYKLPIPPEARQKLASAAIASIGPVTSATLRSLGIEVTLEARESTVNGLMEALEGYFQKTSALS